MIKLIFKILLIIFLSLLCVTLIPDLKIFGIWPNLVLLISITLTLLNFEEDGYLFAGAGGFILDILGSPFLGFNTIIFLTLVYLARYTTKKYFPEIKISFIIFMNILAVFIYELIYNLFLKQIAFSKIVYESFYSILFVLLIYWIIKIYYKKSLMELQ